MNKNDIPEPHELANKPLVEAIFELRWALKESEQGLPPQDPGFRIALGRYYDCVRATYPVLQDLPTAQVPENMTAYAVRHQFRAEKNKWPLTQLGPGILTVNDTAGYTWTNFRPRLLGAIEALFKSYPGDIAAFKPVGVRLRYIDAIPYKPKEMDPVQFLSELLHMQISVEPLLFEDPTNPDAPVRANLNLTFPLKEPVGEGILGFATGARDGRPSIVLETVVRSDGDDVPKEADDFETWLSQAHGIVDKWFFTLCRGKLLESFERKNANTKD